MTLVDKDNSSADVSLTPVAPDYLTAVDVLQGMYALKHGKAAGPTWLTAELFRTLSDSNAFVECVTLVLNSAL